MSIIKLFNFYSAPLFFCYAGKKNKGKRDEFKAGNVGGGWVAHCRALEIAALGFTSLTTTSFDGAQDEGFKDELS